ncbi:MAG TPA: hypothetical protein VFP65_08285 [Anaeromyxobacteraceae bacterium]|nr:hypothetical protein [Anaeromyxobacteraceae bacterium]
MSEDTWSLRVTVDAALEEDLETLIGLLSHKLPKRELHEVVREAVRCAIEKHGKRKGAVEPVRKRKPSVEKSTRREPTAEVRRQVWKRDGGRCTWAPARSRHRTTAARSASSSSTTSTREPRPGSWSTSAPPGRRACRARSRGACPGRAGM